MLIRDITLDDAGAPRLPPDELAQFTALGISVSDTETTGLNRDRNGLTEIASIRGAMEEGQPRLKLFHSFVLPLKPTYRDYMHRCQEAKEQGNAPPPYDRRLYEYAIEPAALAVTGTEILRKRKDGPITGLAVDGKRVEARPFYEVMEDFLAFTRSGEGDVYYNAPFDRPFLGNLIGDVRAHALAEADTHCKASLQDDARLNGNARALCLDYSYTPYAGLTQTQQQEVLAALASMAEVPESYTNPALYQCLYYGFLARAGFGPSNTLDDATRALVDAAHGKRGDHSGIEDVIMAARVGLRLADPGIEDMRGLYENLLRRVDPAGHAEMLPERKHRNGKESVQGDIALHFSQRPEQIGEDAERFWQFLAAFKRAPRINSRVPQHVLEMDEGLHQAVVNAERKQPLSLNFLKKCIFFTQMLHSPVLYTMLPYDSTGNRIDAVLREIDLVTGERRVVEDVHYGSLRANVAFLEAHAQDAASYLTLISRLRKTDRAVGMVLLREREDGAVDVIVKGHLRAFGECVMRIPPGLEIEGALPSLERELLMQIKLGVIPQVGYFGERDDAAAMEDEGDELSTNPQRDRHEDETSSAYVTSRMEPDGQNMSLSLSAAAFACVAFRLEKSTEQLLQAGRVVTANGPIKLKRQEDGSVLLRGAFDAFYDFIETGQPGEVAEKPSNLIRDASWLLYRLERIPGTYGLRIEGDMAVLDQKDGLDVEALGLLYHVGVPFKAYPDAIKVDVRQLMKNAFHWSLALSRAQKERKDMLDAAADARVPSGGKGYKEPQRFLLSIQQALLAGKGHALEMNERRDIWLLDPPASVEEQPAHHALMKNAKGIELVFRGKKLVPEHSSIKGPQRLNTIVARDGSVVVQASPVLFAMAAAQLQRKRIDASAFVTGSTDGWHIPENKKQAVLPMLYRLSSFLDGLGKQTGSQRLGVEQMELGEDETVRFYVPRLRFLGDRMVYDEVLQTHTALASTQADRHMHALQRNLPDPRKVDARRGDVMRMTASVIEQLGDIDGLGRELNRYLRLLGGAEHESDPSAPVFAPALRADLATLGMMLHELAATPHKHEARPELWHAIQTAQEKLSAVTFGFDQLREDLAVARKALVGGAEGEGGLRGEIGHAMGTLLIDAAIELARYDPDAFGAEAMASYREHVQTLLGEDYGEAYGYYARHAAMRYLLQLPDASDPRGLQDTLAHYFLSEAFPLYTVQQRESLIALYRENTPQTQEAVRLQFMTRQSKNGPIYGDILLKQHHLLTHPQETEWNFEQWRAHYDVTDIEDEIASAYQRRGKLYLEMAYIINPYRDDSQAQRAHYLERAHTCLLQAGWTQEKFEKVRASTSVRHLSDARKQYVRAQMELRPSAEKTSLKDLIAIIDLGDTEDVVRQLRLERAYAGYQKECGRLVEDVLDPYYMHKQRMALLGRIEKALKETHDLLMVKYHHVRDLQGLLVLLQQEFGSGHEREAAVGTIGDVVKPIPELAGIRDDTLQQIQHGIQNLHEGLGRHLYTYLRQHHVAASVEDDGAVRCDLRGLQQLFEEWRKDKKPAAAQMPEHLYPWLERASQRLFRCPVVESVALDKAARHVECRVRLPIGEAERAQAWAQLRFAALGLGLRLPPMPHNNGEIHTLRLPLLSRVQRKQTPLDVAAKDRDLREAVGAFAVKEGMPAGWEKSFVAGVMKRRKQTPNAVFDALSEAGKQGADLTRVSEVLERYRQR